MKCPECDKEIKKQYTIIKQGIEVIVCKKCKKEWGRYMAYLWDLPPIGGFHDW